MPGAIELSAALGGRDTTTQKLACLSCAKVCDQHVMLNGEGQLGGELAHMCLLQRLVLKVRHPLRTHAAFSDL
jgi:hypothetical protein